jgi:hypothetical protein
MTKSLERTAQRRKLLGEIERLAEIAVFGTLSGTYGTCGRAGLPLSGRWTQAWSASECELPRGEGEDHGLLCSQGSRGGHERRSRGLATDATVFTRPGGVE